MSRSTSIWAVHSAFGEMVGAFTVRHEMLSWAGTVGDVDGWVVVRWRDGQPLEQRVIFNLSELLERC